VTRAMNGGSVRGCDSKPGGLLAEGKGARTGSSMPSFFSCRWRGWSAQWIYTPGTSIARGVSGWVGVFRPLASTSWCEAAPLVAVLVQCGGFFFEEPEVGARAVSSSCFCTRPSLNEDRKYTHGSGPDLPRPPLSYQVEVLDDIVEDDEVQVVPPSPSGVRALGDDVEDEIVATNNGLSLEMEDTMLAALKHWRTVETGTRWGFNVSWFRAIHFDAPDRHTSVSLTSQRGLKEMCLSHPPLDPRR
jgi:hypothetical protein